MGKNKMKKIMARSKTLFAGIFAGVAIFFYTTTILYAVAQEEPSTDQEALEEALSTLEFLAWAENQLREKIESEGQRLAQKTTIKENTLKRIQELKTMIEDLKQKHGIKDLEQKKELILEEMRTIAAQVYAKNKHEFSNINKILKELKENPELVRLRQEVTEAQVALEKATHEIIGNFRIDEKNLRSTGQIITNNSRSEQNKLNALIANELLPLEQKIKETLLRPDVDKELDSLQNELSKLQDEVAQEVTNLPKEDQQEFRNLQKILERFQLLLKFILSPQGIMSVKANEFQ